MAKGSEYEGKTREEAIEKGLKALGLRREEATIVTIEEGSGGFLGFGKRPFRISVMRRPGGAVREPEETTERRVTSKRDDRRGGRGGRDRDRGRDGRGRDGQPGGKERGREERSGRPQPQEATAARSDAPRSERRDRPRDDRPREDRPRDDRPRGDAPREDRPRGDAPREDRPRGDAPREERPREERGRGGRSRDGRRDERGPREERSPRPQPQPQPQPQPAEAMRPPVADDEGPDELAPAVAAPFGAEGDDSAEGMRRRRRRGRRGGRGRRRGGAHEGGDDADQGRGDERHAPASAGVVTPAAMAEAVAFGPPPVRAAEPPRGRAAEVPPPARASELPPVSPPVRYAEPAPVHEIIPAAPAPVATAAVPAPAQPAAARRDEENEPTMGTTELGETAKKITEDLLRGMGFEATVTVVAEGNRADVTVEVAQGDDLLTGQKGEVRQAMQHLLNRFLNRGEGSRYHLQLEINDFWKRRESELETLARSMADEAVARNAEVVTEYLNSQERRIVHVTLREDTRVKTFALGTGMIKRVAVAPADFPERTGEEDAG